MEGQYVGRGMRRRAARASAGSADPARQASTRRSGATIKVVSAVGGALGALLIILSAVGISGVSANADRLTALGRETKRLQSAVSSLRDDELTTARNQIELLSAKIAAMEKAQAEMTEARVEEVASRVLERRVHSFLRASAPGGAGERLEEGARLFALDVADQLAGKMDLTDGQKSELKNLVADTVQDAGTVLRDVLSQEGPDDDAQLRQKVRGLLERQKERRTKVREFVRGLDDGQLGKIAGLRDRWVSLGSDVFGDIARLTPAQAELVRQANLSAAQRASQIGRDLAAGKIGRQEADALLHAVRDEYRSKMDALQLDDAQRRRLRDHGEAFTGAAREGATREGARGQGDVF